MQNQSQRNRRARQPVAPQTQLVQRVQRLNAVLRARVTRAESALSPALNQLGRSLAIENVTTRRAFVVALMKKLFRNRDIIEFINLMGGMGFIFTPPLAQLVAPDNPQEQMAIKTTGEWFTVLAIVLASLNVALDISLTGISNTILIRKTTLLKERLGQNPTYKIICGTYAVNGILSLVNIAVHAALTTVFLLLFAKSDGSKEGEARSAIASLVFILVTYLARVATRSLLNAFNNYYQNTLTTLQTQATECIIERFRAEYDNLSYIHQVECLSLLNKQAAAALLLNGTRAIKSLASIIVLLDLVDRGLLKPSHFERLTSMALGALSQVNTVKLIEKKWLPAAILVRLSERHLRSLSRLPEATFNQCFPMDAFQLKQDQKWIKPFWNYLLQIYNEPLTAERCCVLAYVFQRKQAQLLASYDKYHEALYKGLQQRFTFEALEVLRDLLAELEVTSDTAAQLNNDQLQALARQGNWYKLLYKDETQPTRWLDFDQFAEFTVATTLLKLDKLSWPILEKVHAIDTEYFALLARRIDRMAEAEITALNANFAAADGSGKQALVNGLLQDNPSAGLATQPMLVPGNN